jgi:hypothetical protein
VEAAYDVKIRRDFKIQLLLLLLLLSYSLLLLLLLLGSKWEEHGSFKKGHKTSGKHEIHKLDESKKEKKFFDEDGDEGYELELELNVA